MRADNTAALLSVLAAYTADVGQSLVGYMQNGLQLNADKLETLMVGTSHQLRAVASAVSTVSFVLASICRYEGIWCRAGSASGLRRACVCCGAILPHLQAIRHKRHQSC